MDDFLKMDIFFAVTTAAVLLLTALVGILIYQAIRLVRTLERIANGVAEEAATIRADLHTLRQEVVEKGLRALPFFSLFGKMATRATGRRKPREKPD